MAAASPRCRDPLLIGPDPAPPRRPGPGESWAAFPEAKSYEVCQDCPIDEDGVRVNTLGTVRLLELDDTCNGKPCVVYQAMPRGRHTFHVRALLEAEPKRYTRWSAPRIYDVQESGTVHDSTATLHDEL